MGVQFIVGFGLEFMEGQVQEGVELLHAAAGAVPLHDRTDNRFGFHNSGSSNPLNEALSHFSRGRSQKRQKYFAPTYLLLTST